MLHSLMNSTNTYVLSYDEYVDFSQRYKKEHRTYIIFNNQVRKKPGEHWLALYLYDNGCVDYFDSYGDTFGSFQSQYRTLFNTLIKHNIKIKHFSRIRVQDYESSLCGAHCLFFLTLRYMDVSFRNIYDKVYDSNDSVSNDSLVEKFLEIFFSEEQKKTII